MHEIIQITVSGPDRPGLSASLMEVLARYQVPVLDISQAVLHETLSLGLLIEVPPQAESSPLLKDLLYQAHTLGVELQFQPVSAKQYEHWVQAQGKQRHIITLLGRKITAEPIARLTQIVYDNGLNIDFITRLSGRISLEQTLGSPATACVEFSVRGTPTDKTALRAAFLDMSKELGVDIGLQEDNAYRRNRRLVAFDMDSTLIQAEVIDELAKEAGVGKEVAEITERAMRGDIDFEQSLRQRVGLLAGLPESALERVNQRLPLTEGANRLIVNLKRLGYKIAILSGGFTYFGSRLQIRFGVDYLYANELEIRDGRLTGRLCGSVVDGQYKAQRLQEIAAREHLSLEQVIAVGDGANDLPMLEIAGLGIAFHAKPTVRAGAQHAISNLGLDSILYFIGLRDREAT
ncbi:MAG: phosphoserine phosphatase SerB [Thermodesulfobacteriota bacterium]